MSRRKKNLVKKSQLGKREMIMIIIGDLIGIETIEIANKTIEVETMIVREEGIEMIEIIIIPEEMIGKRTIVMTTLHLENLH